MACKMRKRDDDIPKRKGEKTWCCDACNAIAFAVRKPVCRKVMQAQINAVNAEAEAELSELEQKDAK